MRRNGFTLAELLIALAILGVIATFTIPKVLNSQQDTKFKSITKETAGMISQAFMSYKLKNALTPTTKPSDLTPYLNYVGIETVIDTDDVEGVAWTDPCSTVGSICLKLHNGGILHAYEDPGYALGGTGTTNGLFFNIDPDGKISNYKAVAFFLYTDGTLRTIGTLRDNSYNQAWGPMYAEPNKDPPWFSWN